MDLARQESHRQRQLQNLNALKCLMEGVAGVPNLSQSFVAQNCLQYKEALSHVIVLHRDALRAHEESMQVNRQLRAAQMIRCDVWRHELAKRQAALTTARQRSAQHAHDEIATQAWRHAPI
ncbi:hypothetical protein EGJ54_24350 [Pandoraea apista]|nr:hypothetical protein EGJ54_24350 [Pandoraea apista]RRW98064.1 hypothetical protein EGJ56_23760 [Pandoraea apista]